MKMKYAGVALAAAAVLFAAGCSSDSDDTATEASPSAAATEAAADETIVAVASGNEDFSTLVAAVDAAGLVDTLNGDGPFTVFAPTNAAFEALPEGVLDALLLPENQEVLTQVLTYHVVPGEITSDMIEPGEVETVEGSPITVSVEGEKVMVDGAEVSIADIETSNGVIHAIDAVILPPDVDPAAL